MKVAMDLYFLDEFRKALATRMGNGGGAMATRNDIRRWVAAILKFASDDVLEHPEPKVITPVEVELNAVDCAK